MLTVNAYGATSTTEVLAPMTIERRDLGPRDVLIEIKYTGICHSDIHHARSDWREETYPIVPGHEIARVVTEVGSEVTKHAVGGAVSRDFIAAIATTYWTVDQDKGGYIGPKGQVSLRAVSREKPVCRSVVRQSPMCASRWCPRRSGPIRDCWRVVAGSIRG